MLSTKPTAPSGCQYLPSSHHQSPNQILLPLTATANSRDCLEIGGCDVTTLVQHFGSPLYILDELTLRTACRRYREAFAQFYPGPSLVLYASKAWSCMAVCRIVASEGLGLDVMSGGEFYTARRAFELSHPSAQSIYFHGNNKSAEELALALKHRSTIVVDNWLELETLARMATPNNPAHVLLRLTPGIECHTHKYIRTGHRDCKFGFDLAQIEAVLTYIRQRSPLHYLGLHAHIGSQIFERQPHQDLAAVLVAWMQRAAELDLPTAELNVGGGLGIRYTEADDPPTITEWVKAVCGAVVEACTGQQLPLPKLIAEPGRSLIGTASVTAYTVGSRKVVPNLRTYIAVDGGMSDNPRPITYQSVHRAVVANRMSAPLVETATVAGKHCESGDILIQDASLPKTQPGDILVVMGTGAYNYSMASNYNRLPRPAAVLVNNGEANIILKRESYEDLLRQDQLPQRLIDWD
ncbi:MAG: diaminopimelate decarboxylase [Cyanophyceae cyanobacterium]